MCVLHYLRLGWVDQCLVGPGGGISFPQSSRTDSQAAFLIFFLGAELADRTPMGTRSAVQFWMLTFKNPVVV